MKFSKITRLGHTDTAFIVDKEVGETREDKSKS